MSDLVTAFEYYKTIMENWKNTELQMFTLERKDGTKVVTINNENVVIAKVLTRADDIIVDVIWPAMRLQ